jgi:hypothetical protein
MVTGGIKLERVKNIRDLSSVRGSGIKAGRIYRTGYLSKASEEDVRSRRERRRAGGKDGRRAIERMD